jgi:hypothetical protein
MTNTIRGESSFIANGEKFLMRLTLGALAEIEDGLGLSSLGDIAARLKQLATSDLATVAAALLRGGGHDVTAADVMRLPTDLGTVVRAVADAFDAVGLTHDTKPAGEGAAPRVPLSGAAVSNSASA